MAFPKHGQLPRCDSFYHDVCDLTVQPAASSSACFAACFSTWETCNSNDNENWLELKCENELKFTKTLTQIWQILLKFAKVITDLRPTLPPLLQG